ncbi:MAG: hypothetical protein M3535_05515 [Actinomycetota bacterium]|nr:hypothetical protein [Actinomycetota bacterium]
MGLSGRVPGRVDEATKAGLLDLLDAATDAGWSWRGACRELELGEVRAYRWLERREQRLPHHTTVTLEGVGHYLQSDAPDELAEAIRRWWRGAECCPR